MNALIQNIQGNITINCGDGVHNITVDDVVGDIYIELGDGDKDILVKDTSAGNVEITTGGGQDNTIDIRNVTNGNVVVTSGDGPHQINITDTLSGNVEVTTESGKDDIHILNTGGDQTITTGEGNDTIIISPVQENTLLRIDAGDGSNRLEINGLIMAYADIRCGGGNDVIILNNATDTDTALVDSTASLALFQRDRLLSAQSTYSINITTGDGYDDIFIKTIPHQCALEIDAGGDDDIINIEGLGYGSDATVLGGAGNDILLVDGRESEDIDDQSQAKNTMVR